ncbi:TPA: glycosyltransferase family 2 protein [Streptococcus agalactiae]|nr:glycosyltransferase [Streptococcus agalactiae]
MALFFTFLKVSQVIFLVLLIAYASFLVISLVIGGVHLYEKNERKKSLTRNKEKIPISIIVPAYNESTTIVSSIDSLLHLDYEAYEIIVVDDGSSDNTSDVLKEEFALMKISNTIDSIIATQTCKDVFQRQVGKVKLTLIVKENGGKGDALNMGINAANYDYFLCLDADSMLQVDSLSQISKSIQVDPTVIAVGGYDTQTLGEDMELVMKLHFFCRNNNIPYRICYETDAVCWSQAPTNLGDLRKQRRRWYLGLYQCLKKYKSIFANYRFGAVGSISYIYYILFELLTPFIECFGIVIIFLSLLFNQLNIPFFISLVSLYIFYCVLITLSSFLHRIYSQQLVIGILDIVKVFYIAVFRYLILHPVLTFVKVASVIGYKNKKMVWGHITREKQMKDFETSVT